MQSARFYCAALSIMLGSFSLNAQKTTSLAQKIESIISGKKADVGVSVIGVQKNDKVLIHGDQFYPMLSTFKFPIALTTLHQVEKGRLSLDQKLFIKKEELLENTWSPFKEKHPEGNITISLEEALQWMMCYSDNNLTDIILRLIGGTEPVQKFIGSGFIIKNNEEEMHKDWDAQFINKITPRKAADLLEKFYQGKILNKAHTQWLYNAMLNNRTGLKRLKGKLPENVKAAHISGTSFTNEAGMTGAVNSYGIIELSGNRKIVVAVFVHDTYESFDNAETIIADISKAAYDHYNTK